MSSKLRNDLPWQLKIFSKTLKKKEKLSLIKKVLPELAGKKCLDLGCAKGTISYFLTREGGLWFHEDLDYSNVFTTKELVGARTAVISNKGLPHGNNTFDLVLSLDILEHIREDQAFLDEIIRVIKPGRHLILSTPITGKFFVVNMLKNLTGLTPDVYGHVIEGYELDALSNSIKNRGMNVVYKTTYSKFFTEFIEFLINFVFIKLLSKNDSHTRDGHISPSTQEEVAKYKKQLKLYSLIYPFIWLITRLDKLIWWSGYATLIVARKPTRTKE